LSAAEKPAATGGGLNPFRKSKYNLPRLSKESAARQGKITTLAFTLLGGRDGAMAFLNGVNDELGGRPIDLATASDAGYANVERAMRLAVS
jgi:hypothetical protein